MDIISLYDEFIADADSIALAYKQWKDATDERLSSNEPDSLSSEERETFSTLEDILKEFDNVSRSLFGELEAIERDAQAIIVELKPIFSEVDSTL